MTNPNNCATCDHIEYPGGGGHCYMFREAPTDVCMCHTGRKEFSSIGNLVPSQFGSTTLQALILRNLKGETK